MARSTAPAIASPLVAWPARPSPRFSPASPSFPEPTPAAQPSRYSRSASVPLDAAEASPSRATRHPTPDVYVHAAGADGGELADDDDDGQHGWVSRRDYPPPARPLKPHQLGRIAQSFGIVVPHLPQSPSLSPAASPLFGGARAGSPISSYGGGLGLGLGGRARSATPHSSLLASTYLITVVPPLVLLPPSPMPDGGGAADADGRARRWRRGRLLPLQPTLGAMLVAIAREFGLPATTGVAVYLVHAAGGGEARRDSLSADSHGETDGEGDVDGTAAGPLVSAHTWTTLFAGYLHGAPPSLASTPSSTPHRPPRSATAASTHGAPPSPLSMASDRPRRGRHAKSLSGGAGPAPTPVKAPSQSSLSSASSHLPVTPSSMTPTTASTAPALPIVGTIEFDIDPDDAPWYGDWQRAGGPSRRAAQLDRGVRELALVGKLGDARPRFLREADAARSSGAARAAAGGYAALDSEGEGDGDGDSGSSTGHAHRRSDRSIELIVKDGDGDPLADVFPSAAAEFASLRAGRPEPGRRLSIRDIGTDRALSASASMSALEDDDDEYALGPQDDVGDVRRMIGDAMLASPIALDAAHLDDERRGSGLVMADQLDSLERSKWLPASPASPAAPAQCTALTPVMRDLSPREIRLTSPRHLTPRTAGKIGLTVDPTLAPPARHSKPTSPLAGTFIGPDGERTSPAAAAAARPAWPAVPFAQISEHGSPNSPGSIHEFFRKDALPAPSGAPSPTTMSAETLQRMQAEPAPRTVASEWKPPRRPSAAPSANGGGERQASSSSTPTSPALPPAARTPDPSEPASDAPADTKRRTRSSSISLKGLRSRSSRRSDKDRERAGAAPVPDVPALPALPARPAMPAAPGSPAEPVGLFRGASVEAAHASSFTGLRAIHDAPDARDAPSLSEFGHLGGGSGAERRPSSALSGSTTASAGAASASLPAKGRDKDGFASRFFSFGARRRETAAAAGHAPAPPPPELADAAAPAGPAPGARRKSRRQPSDAAPAAAISISAPTHVVKHDPVLPPAALREYAQLASARPAHPAHPAHPGHATHAHARTGSVDDARAGARRSTPTPASPTTPTSPASQASPRHVRRKPVPAVEGGGGAGGVPESPSLASVVSVLEARAR